MKTLNLTDGETETLTELLEGCERGFEAQKLLMGDDIPPPPEVVSFYGDLSSILVKVKNARPMLEPVKLDREKLKGEEK